MCIFFVYMLRKLNIDTITVYVYPATMVFIVLNV